MAAGKPDCDHYKYVPCANAYQTFSAARPRHHSRIIHILVIYLVMFSAKRWSIAATCSRVAFPLGASVLFPVPDMSFSPTAHETASFAKAETFALSLKPAMLPFAAVLYDLYAAYLWRIAAICSRVISLFGANSAALTPETILFALAHATAFAYQSPDFTSVKPASPFTAGSPASL